MTAMPELVWKSATELSSLIARKEISAVELMTATYEQIGSTNPALNALVNLLPIEKALQLAAAVDKNLNRNDLTISEQPLLGLPMAAKDSHDAQGFPTTFGYVPYADRVARTDDELVRRQKSAGALIIAKSNMPEFGLGSNTFNSLFGTSKNPYDLGKTPGGSSGGAAAALASGMLTIADGSDMGGSLRNPAAFCNVVGLRPSIGRMPDQSAMGWSARISTTGPLARTVADVALLFGVQAGPDPRDPLSQSTPGAGMSSFSNTKLDPKSLRIAFSPDLGHLDVEREVEEKIVTAANVFADLGAQVEPNIPDLSGAMDVFQVQRAAVLTTLGNNLQKTLPNWREHAKATVQWNIDKGLELKGSEIIEAEIQKTRIYRRVVAFFEKYDALLLPATQVLPFDTSTEWVEEINGVKQNTYIDWMAACCEISITGLPAISVPAGFSSSGLPIGLQIVGPPRGDFSVLKIAELFEQATRHYQRAPSMALS